MSISSEDSLTELPLPFDISSAVSRALRISSSSDGTNVLAYTASHESYPANEGQGQTLTGFDGPMVDIRARSDGCYISDYCCVQDCHHPFPSYYQQLELPPGYMNPSRMDLPIPAVCDTVSGSNSTVSIGTNADDYIDSSSSQEYFEYYEFGRQPPHNGRTQSCSYSNFYSNESPPRKRRRNTVTYSKEDDCYSPLRNNPGSYSNWPWMMSLENSSLWRRFDEIGTEMVVTKGGRRMFPHLEVAFQNLDPATVYSVKFEILPCDGKRYKFLKTEWVPTGRAEKKQIKSEYEHPDSPNTGSFWMSKPVTFKMVKLTNNKATKFMDQIILNSMQKYQPSIKLTDEKLGGTKSFSFPETTFVAVTAYQNSVMTQMKIDHNPYARAFREGVQTDLYSEKKGGHFDRFKKSTSTSPTHQGYKTRKQCSVPSSPRTSNSTSATSVDSGCEGSSVMPSEEPLLVDDKSILKSAPLTSNSLSYWADDNSLWNPNLITPDPLMDSTGSFSEPYLQQTTQLALVYDVSPVKGLFDAEDSYLLSIQEPHCTPYILDSVIDDDVFF